MMICNNKVENFAILHFCLDCLSRQLKPKRGLVGCLTPMLLMHLYVEFAKKPDEVENTFLKKVKTFSIEYCRI